MLVNLNLGSAQLALFSIQGRTKAAPCVIELTSIVQTKLEALVDNRDKWKVHMVSSKDDKVNMAFNEDSKVNLVPKDGSKVRGDSQEVVMLQTTWRFGKETEELLVVDINITKKRMMMRAQLRLSTK